jgi:hypothetical protein
VKDVIVRCAMDLKQLLDRAEYTIDYQRQEIDKLREQVDRLTVEADAHTTLRSIYTDPNASEGNRIKAAAASLPHEKPKMMSVPAPLELEAAEIVPLRELVRQRKERQARLQPPYKVLPNNQVVLLEPHGNGDGNPDGNGSDSNNNAPAG